MTDKIETNASDDTPTPSRRMDRLEAKIDDVIARLPEPAPNAGWTSGVHRGVNWFERMWLTRLLASLGIWLFLATVVGLYWETQVRSEERAARTEEAEFRKLAQVATAWEVLLTPAGGDIGKGNALNTLVKAGHQVVGADLSCEAVGTWKSNQCQRAPMFSNVFLGQGELWNYAAPQRNRFGTNWSPVFRHRDATQYLEDFSFEAAEINGLRATILDMSNNFSAAKGLDWIVRDAFTVERQFDWRNMDAAFQCKGCSFYQSILDWPVIEGMMDGIVSDTYVAVTPIDVARIDDIRSGKVAALHQTRRDSLYERMGVFLIDDHPPAAVSLTTHLSHPVVVYKAHGVNQLEARTSWALPRAIAEIEQLEDTLVWPVYLTMNYCVSRADFDILLPHFQAEAELGRLENAEALQDQLARGEISTFKAGIRPMVWISEVSEAFGFPMTAFHEPRATQHIDYECQYNYHDVAPLLEQRLFDILSE